MNVTACEIQIGVYDADNLVFCTYLPATYSTFRNLDSIFPEIDTEKFTVKINGLRITYFEEGIKKTFLSETKCDFEVIV